MNTCLGATFKLLQDSGNRGPQGSCVLLKQWAGGYLQGICRWMPIDQRVLF